MSTSLAVPSAHPPDSNGSSTSLHTLEKTVEQAQSRTGRLNALARLRLPSPSPRRRKEASPLQQSRKESTMSICSEATAVSPLPSSASELTLAPSLTPSGMSVSEKHEHRSLRSFVSRSSKMFGGKRGSSRSNKLASPFGTDFFLGSESCRSSIDSTRRPATSYSSRASSRARQVHDPMPQVTPRIQISEPFNFQHVAHTAPVQAMNALRQVSPEALESEFSALQAGQIPSGQVKHIEATHLRPTTSDGSVASISPTSSSTSSPTKVRPALRTITSQDSIKRQSKSFSQPFLPSGPAPPPRGSSRKGVPRALAIHTTLPAMQESPTIPEFVIRPRTAPSAQSPLRIAASAASTPLGLTGVVHAVTTPDDSAYVVFPDSISTVREVPEEESATPKSSQHTRQSASVSTTATIETVSDDGPANRMLRSGSDPVLPESAANAEDIPQRNSRRISTAHAGEVNWDDEIDYCYDHALDADSTEIKPTDVDSPMTEVDELIYMKSFRRGSGSSSKETVERVLSRTATSSSTAATPTIPSLHLRQSSSQSRIATTTLSVPTMLDAPMDSAGNVMFTLSPSMIIPKEYNSPPESPFQPRHRRQASNRSSKSGQLPMFTPLMGDLNRTYSSPRSSVTYSSSDSMRNSGLALDSLTTSTTSIPDLIQSGRRQAQQQQQQQRKSNGGTRSTRSSVYSQTTNNGGDASNAPPTPTIETQQAAPTAVTEAPASAVAAAAATAAATNASESKEAEDVLAEMPSSSRTQTGRARAQSEAAGRATVAAAAAAAVGGTAAKAAHGRSASSAVATLTKQRPTYSLFPPLDRIGATPSARV